MSNYKNILQSYSSHGKSGIEDILDGIIFQLDTKKFSEEEEKKFILQYLSFHLNNQTDPAKRHFLQDLVKQLGE